MLVWSGLVWTVARADSGGVWEVGLTGDVPEAGARVQEQDGEE